LTPIAVCSGGSGERWEVNSNLATCHITRYNGVTH
jgi:hypothetical protein